MIPNKFFLAALIVVAIVYFFSKNRNRSIRNVAISMFCILILLQLVPRIFKMPQKDVSFIKGFSISYVILAPSQPKWDVNLTNKTVIINDQKIVDSIHHILDNDCTLTMAPHPERIWQENIFLVTKANDTIKIDVHKTKNVGTLIYFQDQVYENEAMGKFLEGIVRNNS